MLKPLYAAAASVVCRGQALGLVSAIESRAQSIEDAQALFDAGEFVAAADAGTAAGTSDSFALAAVSLAVYGYYVAAADEKQAVFERCLLYTYPSPRDS